MATRVSGKDLPIPFWVPGMNAAMRKAIIEDALPNNLNLATTGQPQPSPQSQPRDARTPETGSVSPPTAAEQPALPLPTMRLVSLRNDERTALVSAANIAGETPRRLKRLARSYLLLRSSLPESIYRAAKVKRAFSLSNRSVACRGVQSASAMACTATEDSRRNCRRFTEFASVRLQIGVPSDFFAPATRRVQTVDQ